MSLYQITSDNVSARAFDVFHATVVFRYCLANTIKITAQVNEKSFHLQDFPGLQSKPTILVKRENELTLVTCCDTIQTSPK